MNKITKTKFHLGQDKQKKLSKEDEQKLKLFKKHLLMEVKVSHTYQKVDRNLKNGGKCKIQEPRKVVQVLKKLWKFLFWEMAVGI